MGYIKKLKNNELVGGTDKTTIYPVTSTEAVFEEITEGSESNFKSQKFLNNNITGNRINKETITDYNIAVGTVTKEKLTPQVQTMLDEGQKKALTPKGDYNPEDVYEALDLVFDRESNSSYVSLITPNTEPLTNEDAWEMFLDGTAVNTAQATINDKVDELDAQVDQAIEDARQELQDATNAANGAAELAMDVVANKVADAQVGYFECNTIAGTALKQTTFDYIGTGDDKSYYTIPAAGSNVRIKMQYANTASGTVELQFGSNTATRKQLIYNDKPASASNTWEEGEVISVYYDGTYYQASNAQGGGGKAEKIKYDNSQSGLAAENVQAALDEAGGELYNQHIYPFVLGSIDGATGQDVVKTDGTRIRTLGYVKRNTDQINFTITRSCTCVNIILYNHGVFAGSIESAMSNIEAGNYVYDVNVNYAWDSYRIVGFTSGYTEQNIDGNYSIEFTSVSKETVAELQSRIKDAEEYADVNLSLFKREGYVGLDGSAESLTPVQDKGWENIVYPCRSYDEFIVTSSGGTIPRAYGFMDTNFNVLKAADASTGVDNFLTTAPYGSAYLVVNGLKKAGEPRLSVVARKRQDISVLDAIQLRLNGGYSGNFEIGSMDSTTFETIEANNRLRMTRPMPIIAGAETKLNIPFNSQYRYSVFYYKNDVCEECDNGAVFYTGSRIININDSGTYDSFRVVIYGVEQFTNEVCAATSVTIKGIAIEQESAQFSVNLELSSLYFVQGNINGETGEDLVATNVIRTFGFLAISPNSIVRYSLNEGYRIGFCFYSAKKNGYIKAVEWLTTGGCVICPKDARYMRIVIASPSGSSSTPSFNDTGLTLSVNKKMVVKEFAADAGYTENIEEAEKIEWENGGIDFPSGDNIEHDKRIRTVKAYEVSRNFYVSVADGYYIAPVFYDKWGNNINVNSSVFVSGGSYVQLPTGCYVRFVVKRKDDGDITVDDLNVSDVMIPLLKKDARTYNYGVDFNADTVTVADIYKHLHNVTVKHSNYITETKLGDDASEEYPIMAYTLGNGNKKIFIVVGQHGPQSDPWDSVVTATRFITQIADTTYNTEFADHLRSEYTLCIVPCCNPYGLDHFNVIVSDSDSTPGGRNNYNGVNLNRDWGVFSQPETTCVNTMIQSLQPNAIIDLHTTGDYLTGSALYKGKQWIECNHDSLNEIFNGELASKHSILYNINLSADATSTQTKLSVYGDTIADYSMCAECNWWINGYPEPHSSQIESANMSLLVNCIKIIASAIEDIAYVYERVPKQSQAY